VYSDGFGIAGEIENVGTEKATDVKVIATYQDRKGEVVAATSTYLRVPTPEQSDIDPGQIAQFELLLSERTTYVYTYELTADSSEYACVGEQVGEPQFSPTDLNKDGVINIIDIAIVAKAFGATPQHPRWNSIADLDDNGIIDRVDISEVAKDYGKHTPTNFFNNKVPTSIPKFRIPITRLPVQGCMFHEVLARAKQATETAICKSSVSDEFEFSIPIHRVI
jgi:hypothetical protein